MVRAPVQQTETAREVLDAWRMVLATWTGATWHELAHVTTPDGPRATVGHPVVRLALPGGRNRALLIAGTHGDEPAGPRALLRFFASGEAAARRERWSFDVLPLVNPLGFDRGTRGRQGCRDLNRTFGGPRTCPDSAAIWSFVSAGSLRQPRWDVALSLHEDPEAGCLYCYDTGDHERHRFAAALQQTVAFLDWVEAHGTPVCDSAEVESAPNRGGVLIGAQDAFPALEPLLFRTHRARRVVVVEAPGQSSTVERERLHLRALHHFLPDTRHANPRTS